MKKVGIITVHKTLNYGGSLQAFALYIYLKKKGVNVEVIDIENKYIEQSTVLLRMEPSIKGVLKLGKDLLRLKNRKVAIKKFEKFRNRIDLSKKVSRNTISQLNDKYDLVITGSDQIWNPVCTAGNSETLDKVYMLDFCPDSVRKVSFSSSMGSFKLDEKLKNEFFSLIDRFDALSTRESDTCKMINKNSVKEVKHTCDPTLLFNQDEWKSLLGLEVNNNIDDIFSYSLKYSNLTKECISSVKAKLGKQCSAISMNITVPSEIDTHIKGAGPLDFIQSIMGSSFIVTDSFHGVVFSLIFDKPFLAISHGSNLNRILSLLNLVGEEDRIIYDVKSIENINLDKLKETNYDFKMLNSFILSSKEYIGENIVSYVN